MKRKRPLYEFHYRFADETSDSAVAQTSGDARALIKKLRGIKRSGRLPVVVAKARSLVS